MMMMMMMGESAFVFLPPASNEAVAEGMQEKQGGHGDGSDGEEGEEQVEEDLVEGVGEEEEDENGKRKGQHIGTHQQQVDLMQLERQKTAEEEAEDQGKEGRKD
jgi:hypothetical protein